MRKGKTPNYEVMKAGIFIYEQFQKKQIVKTKELAKQLDLSPRTIARYLDTLSGIIPIVAIRGRYGGWKKC